MIFSTGPLMEVGRIIRTHGYEGKVRIEIYDSIDIDFKEPLFLMFDQKPVPFFITEHSKSNPYISRIEGINSLEAAQNLLGKAFYLPEFEFEQEEEDSIIGFEVKETTIGSIGIVKDIIENSAQDLMVIQKDDKEFLIPFVEEFIVELNEEHRIIMLNLPDGLVNLDS